MEQYQGYARDAHCARDVSLRTTRNPGDHCADKRERYRMKDEGLDSMNWAHVHDSHLRYDDWRAGKCAWELHLVLQYTHHQKSRLVREKSGYYRV